MYLSPVKLFVYPLKMMGGGLHEKIPVVQGFWLVVNPSTGLQPSSYTVPLNMQINTIMPPEENNRRPYSGLHLRPKPFRDRWQN